MARVTLIPFVWPAVAVALVLGACGAVHGEEPAGAPGGGAAPMDEGRLAQARDLFLRAASRYDSDRRSALRELAGKTYAAELRALLPGMLRATDRATRRAAVEALGRSDDKTILQGLSDASFEQTILALTRDEDTVVATEARRLALEMVNGHPAMLERLLAHEVLGSPEDDGAFEAALRQAGLFDIVAQQVAKAISDKLSASPVGGYYDGQFAVAARYGRASAIALGQLARGQTTAGRFAASRGETAYLDALGDFADAPRVTEADRATARRALIAIRDSWLAAANDERLSAERPDVRALALSLHRLGEPEMLREAIVELEVAQQSRGDTYLYFEVARLLCRDDQPERAVDQYRAYAQQVLKQASANANRGVPGGGGGVGVAAATRGVLAGTYYNVACVFSKANRVDEGLRYLRRAICEGYGRNSGSGASEFAWLKEDGDLEALRKTNAYAVIIGYLDLYYSNRSLITQQMEDDAIGKECAEPFTMENLTARASGDAKSPGVRGADAGHVVAAAAAARDALAAFASGQPVSPAPGGQAPDRPGGAAEPDVPATGEEDGAAADQRLQELQERLRRLIQGLNEGRK